MSSDSISGVQSVGRSSEKKEFKLNDVVQIWAKNITPKTQAVFFKDKNGVMYDAKESLDDIVAKIEALNLNFLLAQKTIPTEPANSYLNMAFTQSVNPKEDDPKSVVVVDIPNFRDKKSQYFLRDNQHNQVTIEQYNNL